MYVFDTVNLSNMEFKIPVNTAEAYLIWKGPFPIAVRRDDNGFIIDSAKDTDVRIGWGSTLYKALVHFCERNEYEYRTER